jgi:hypothetical protein
VKILNGKMTGWIGGAICIAALVVSLSPPVLAQVKGDEKLAIGPIVALSKSDADYVDIERVLADECDNDLDGAIVGGLIGGSTAILALVLAGIDDAGGEQYIPLFGVGVLGGIAGFWIGVGIDSAHCRNPVVSG